MKRGTPDHPKMIMLQMQLQEIYIRHKAKNRFPGRTAAVGIMESLWEWTSKYAIQGDIGKWPNEVIAKGIGWEWDGDELIKALVKSKWLDLVPDPARLVIHDIADHATNTWRQNLQNAGLNWWDGSPPRKYKIERPSRFASQSTRQEASSPPSNANGSGNLIPNQWAVDLLVHYPGVSRLPGFSPDPAIIDRCVQIATEKAAEQQFRYTPEQLMTEGLRLMIQDRKEPSTSWAWFPKVLAHYLQLNPSN